MLLLLFDTYIFFKWLKKFNTDVSFSNFLKTLLAELIVRENGKAKLKL